MFSVLGITLFGLNITSQFIPDSVFNTVELSSFSLSVVTTIMSTTIIVIRIVMVSRMPGASYKPPIAMEIIVESAVLYSISALVYTPMLALFNSPTAATYELYANIFFAYMAVESHTSSLSILIS
jgi:hypothetical protein